MAIHPTAVVDRAAEIDGTADIGAYAIVERGAHIGPECRLWPHAFIAEGTTLGRGVQVHPFAVVGHWPQDLKWDGCPSYARVGDRTVIREHATIHRGTMPDSTTLVGAECYIMAAGHIGHNCTVGERVIIANTALLAGHVQVGDRAFISGGVAVHQFTRVGELAILSGRAKAVTNDAPPFMTIGPAGPTGLNLVGLRRAGLSTDELRELRVCYRVLYRERLPWAAALERATEIAQTPAGQRLIAYLKAPSKRGHLRFKREARGADEE